MFCGLMICKNCKSWPTFNQQGTDKIQILSRTAAVKFYSVKGSIYESVDEGLTILLAEDMNTASQNDNTKWNLRSLVCQSVHNIWHRHLNTIEELSLSTWTTVTHILAKEDYIALTETIYIKYNIHSKFDNNRSYWT